MPKLLAGDMTGKYEECIGGGKKSTNFLYGSLVKMIEFLELNEAHTHCLTPILPVLAILTANF